MTHASTVVGIDSKTPQVVRDFQLSQNYPNPFNPTTSFSYVIPQTADVSIAIYNIRGELVRTLESGNQTAGRHETNWNGLNDGGQIVSSGIYIYSLISESQTISKQMLFLK
jgi:flagellar hook assembly protein FlgD